MAVAAYHDGRLSGGEFTRSDDRNGSISAMSAALMHETQLSPEVPVFFDKTGRLAGRLAHDVQH